MFIAALHLKSPDLEKTLHFYQDVMQLPVADTPGGITVRIGSTVVYFDRANTGNPTYHLACNIPCNRIQEAATWMTGRATLLWLDDFQAAIADFTNWNARSIYFFDSTGNILELIARDDLSNAADQPFSSEQLLCVSEIGVVFPEASFDRDVHALLETLDLSYFSKQPPLPHFRAAGNDDGLFIMVPEGRPWYPTKDVFAGLHPLEVTVETGSRTFRKKIH